MKIKLADNKQVTNLNKITDLINILQEQKNKILSGGKMDMFFDYWLPSDLDNIMESAVENGDYDVTEDQTQKIITDFCSENLDCDANNPLSWDDITEHFCVKLDELF